MEIFKIKHQQNTAIVIKENSTYSILNDIIAIGSLLQHKDVASHIKGLPKTPLQGEIRDLLAPVDDQEVWGCGVTYFNSRLARNEESGQKVSLYDQVYSSTRPQIFYKGRGANTVGHEGSIKLRSDSSWTVPEPELVLVLNRFGDVVGYTAGNDVSCRDIEGENPLFQPQAKVWDGSCSIGPAIVLCAPETLKSLAIKMTIERDNSVVFSGETTTSKIVRDFSSLADFLFKFRSFENGTFLFTGTGIIPENSFSLRQNDEINIYVGDSLTLHNKVL